MIMPEIRIIESGNWKSVLARTPPKIVLYYTLELHTSPGVIVVNDVNYPIATNDFSFCRPGEIRYSDPPSQTKYIRFEVYNGKCEGFTDILGTIPTVCPSSSFQKKSYMRIFDYIEHTTAVSEYQKYLLLVSVLIGLAEKTCCIPENDTSKKQHSQAVFSAVCFMREHLYEKLTVDDIAASIGYSTPHFNRIFKEYTHNTPYSYYLYLKITEAKRLMLTSQQTLAEISESLGFCSSSNFGYAFRNIALMTPVQFRKKYNGFPQIEPEKEQ